MKVVTPRKLVHSGKKRAYPSVFVWDCPEYNQWNTWKTKMLHGTSPVRCSKCRKDFHLDKEHPKEEITRKKSDKTII